MKPDLQKYGQLYAQRCHERGEFWEGKFSEYEQIVANNPAVARTAYQRGYDMILSYGTEIIQLAKEKIVRYKFFDDPDDNGRDAIFGLEKPLGVLVNAIKSAALRYGTERRVLLLHGPVGSSKSTIARLLKKGLERYSRKEAGKLFRHFWKAETFYGFGGELAKKINAGSDYVPCPMHEDPLRLIPTELRGDYLAEMLRDQKPPDYQLTVEGDLCPVCRMIMNGLLPKYQGNFAQAIEDNILIRRMIISEQDRLGVGTFQPKDEKNQDSTDLTGDLNYRNIAIYGSDSDPRAFNFDGEFEVANRGLIEFIELLKLDVAFLYDLLGVSQEHKIKPKKFSQIDVDLMILGHTNEPEYRKLQSNEFMEALRDRTVKIDIPYVVKLDNEIKVYGKDYNLDRIHGKHIAPHTLEMAAMWAVLTRLDDPKKANLTRLQKLKLYNGKTLPGFTDDNIKELQEESPKEGMSGISARYSQDKISNALVGHPDEPCLNPFMVLNELEDGLRGHSLINSEDLRKQYVQLIEQTKEEYEDIVKNEVQRAIAADKEALDRLAQNYIDHVKAYTLKERVKNKYTGQKEAPDERLMRSVEHEIDIPDNRKDDFRRELMNYIGAKAVEGKTFDYRENERLLKALELKLFKDQKDTIKLTSLATAAGVDKDTQQKIDIVKGRLIKDYGYCDHCAGDVLQFVASLFARADVKKTS